MLNNKENFRRMQVLYLTIIFLLVCVCAVLLWMNSGTKFFSDKKKLLVDKKYESDAERFRESYEALNNTTREDGTYLSAVTIQGENAICYISPEEAWELIDKDETTLIVFGAAWCRWCLAAAPLLVDISNANNLDIVYYVEVTEIEGEKSEARQSLEKLMSDYLRQAGSSFANVTGTRVLITEYQEFLAESDSLLFPVVLFVNKGNLTGMHVGTADDQSDVTEQLTERQIDNFRQSFKKHLNVLGTSPCGSC